MRGGVGGKRAVALPGQTGHGDPAITARHVHGHGQLAIDMRIGDHRLVEQDAAERKHGRIHAPRLQRLVDRVQQRDPGEDVNVLHPV